MRIPVPGRPASLPSFRFCVLEARGATPRHGNARRPRDAILVGDCVAETREAARRLASISSSPIRPTICSSRARFRVPTRASSTRSTTTGTSSPISPTYDAFTRGWLGAARRVMKRDATIVVIGSYHNIFRVGAILQDLGFWILNDIVWRKANPMPNFRGRRFTNAHETMIWAARSADAKAYTFNYEALKAGNEDCQARSDWFLPICTGAERLKDARGRKTHPTQKPEALLPARAARGLQPRRSRARSVLRLGHHRRRRAPPAAASSSGWSATRLMPPRRARASTRSFRSPPRRSPRSADASAASRASPSPAWSRPGCRAGRTAGRRRSAATAPLVRADGALTLGPAIGSIHKIGALVQGLPACNGWTFWHVERAGRAGLASTICAPPCAPRCARRRS